MCTHTLTPHAHTHAHTHTNKHTQTHTRAQDGTLIGGDGDVSDFFLQYFYVSLGDVQAGHKNASQSGFLMILYLTFVLLTTVLMLNLLIAIMGNTYQEDSQKQGFSMWWSLHAALVLQYESDLNTPITGYSLRAWSGLFKDARSGMDLKIDQDNSNSRPFYRKRIARL